MADEELLSRAQSRVGTTLRGKYRIERVLGVGGMAVVYAATHRNGRPVAIKMLHPELSLRGDLRTRFLREGHAANAVKHPGAVAVLDDEVAEDGAAFLVMELLDGAAIETLWEREHRRLPLDAVLAIGDQLLDVLTVAHAAGVVHRDLKPANLFLTRESVVKVLDFGIARIRDVTASQATQTGMMLGTPAYMAPEQALGRASEIDAKTDLWAVGATLYTLASGRFVHDGDTPQTLLVKAATAPARSLARVVDAHPSVTRVVDRALAFDKSARWSSATAMRDALRAASSEAFGRDISAEPLKALVRAIPESVLAPTLPEHALAHGPTVQASDVVSTVPKPAQGEPANARLLAPLIGGTTAQPVSAGAPLPTPQQVSKLPTGRRPSLGLVAAFAGGAVLLVGVAVAALRAGPTVSPSAATSVTDAMQSPPAVASKPVALPSAAPSVPEIAVSDLPIVPVAPSTMPPASKPPAPPRASAPPGASATTPPKANCATPYEMDAQGHKKWKAECL